MLRNKSWWERLPNRGKIILILGLYAVVFMLIMPRNSEPAAETQPGTADVQTLELLEKRRLDTRPILVLDAGHGGDDPGAVTADGSVYESTITSEMVERVMALLAAHEDELQVLRAVEAGLYESPLGRANVASAAQADLLVSLHLNADVSTGTRGFQIFPAPPGRVYHEESVRFCELAVAKMRAANALIMGETGIFYAYYLKTEAGYYNKVIVERGHLAELLDDESFGVVEYPGCPTALVELWHITSPEDMALFNNEAGKAQVASAVYLAICDYFGLAPAA